jgi:hypothetical protein
MSALVVAGSWVLGTGTAQDIPSGSGTIQLSRLPSLEFLDLRNSQTTAMPLSVASEFYLIYFLSPHDFLESVKWLDGLRGMGARYSSDVLEIAVVF